MKTETKILKAYRLDRMHDRMVKKLTKHLTKQSGKKMFEADIVRIGIERLHEVHFGKEKDITKK
jgi:hypothetical protein